MKKLSITKTKIFLLSGVVLFAVFSLFALRVTTIEQKSSTSQEFTNKENLVRNSIELIENTLRQNQVSLDQLEKDNRNYQSLLRESNNKDSLESNKRRIIDDILRKADFPVPPREDDPLPAPPPFPPPRDPPPNPDFPPKPDPTPSDDDYWSNVLKEIHNFLVKKPTSLTEVEQFAVKYPDPLVGVDLKGASIKELTKKGVSPINFNAWGRNCNLGDVKSLWPLEGNGDPWRNYQMLSASGDGNCFFNSFSILLVGDESLAMKLRVATCLCLMKNSRIFCREDYFDEKSILAVIQSELVKGRITVDGGWASNAHILYLGYLFKKPILCFTNKYNNLYQNFSDYFAYQLVGYPWNVLDADVDVEEMKNRIKEIISEINAKKNDYNKFFVIYNSGNHFQPLIVPN